MGRKAVFLDRDGVLNALVYRSDDETWDSPYTLEEFRVLPFVAEGVRLINDFGYLAVVVSNQPGVAKGKCGLKFIEQLHSILRLGLADKGAILDAIYYCPHHPDGLVDEFAIVCECRKPKPGLLLRAAEEFDIELNDSYMIGDRLIDVEAGHAVGCTTILISDEAVQGSRQSATAQPAGIATDLRGAVEIIRAHGGRNGHFPR